MSAGGDLPSWVAAIAGSVAALAGSVAAFASVAVWVRGFPTVDIVITPDDTEGRYPGRFEVRNLGDATAKDVHVRLGSESDSNHVFMEESVAALGRNEQVKILAPLAHGLPGDMAVNVTWRGRRDRRELKVYRIYP